MIRRLTPMRPPALESKLLQAPLGGGVGEPVSGSERDVVLTWVSAGPEATACTKHLFGLSPIRWQRVVDDLQDDHSALESLF